MTVQADDRTSVRKGVVVNGSPERAFSVFTEGMASWWPSDHHLLPGELAEMRVEPEVGGRIYDLNVDGQECTWGRVATWEPPHIFAFHWLIGPDWGVPHPDAPASLVTVTFTPLDDGRTSVELVHEHLDQHGEGWEAVRDGVGSPNGWALTLQFYAAAVG